MLCYFSPIVFKTTTLHCSNLELYFLVLSKWMSNSRWSTRAVTTEGSSCQLRGKDGQGKRPTSHLRTQHQHESAAWQDFCNVKFDIENSIRQDRGNMICSIREKLFLNNSSLVRRNSNNFVMRTVLTDHNKVRDPRKFPPVVIWQLLAAFENCLLEKNKLRRHPWWNDEIQGHADYSWMLNNFGKAYHVSKKEILLFVADT